MVWLAFLFVNLALIVDFRISPNLTSLVRTLKMSDSLAGVTLLAMGNGAADVFTAAAAAAASADGGELAVAGMLGGALFVTTVVAGAIVARYPVVVPFRSLGRYSHPSPACAPLFF